MKELVRFSAMISSDDQDFSPRTEWKREIGKARELN